MTHPNNPEFVTVAEVARRLRVSKMTVYRMVHNGEIRSTRINQRTFRIPAEALDEYLAARTGGGNA